jgi:hypothetical protein
MMFIRQQIAEAGLQCWERNLYRGRNGQELTQKVRRIWKVFLLRNFIYVVTLPLIFIWAEELFL